MKLGKQAQSDIRCGVTLALIGSSNGETEPEKATYFKVPTIADRAWQCLVKFALEPAHEATFHARSYGFRPGRSAHDAQKHLFDNLNSRVNGKEKRVIELDIEKCFDRISHSNYGKTPSSNRH